MTRMIAILSTAVLLLLIGLTWALTLRQSPDDAFAQCRESAVAGGAGTIGGAFELVDEDGRTVTDAEVLSKPSLVYFGYTFCPDVCPMDAARNAEAVTELADRGIDVQPVFITVDPKRDTPEVLKEFTDYMHPEMLGLSGTTEQVKAAADAYRVYFRLHDPEPGAEDFYLVDHSTFTYLTLPGAGFVDYFRRDAEPSQIADRVQCFVDAL